MPLIPDQGPVQQLVAAGLHPALHDRVHPRHPDAAEHDLDPRIGEDRVEQGGETSRPGPGSRTAPDSRRPPHGRGLVVVVVGAGSRARAEIAMAGSAKPCGFAGEGWLASPYRPSCGVWPAGSSSFP